MGRPGTDCWTPCYGLLWLILVSHETWTLISRVEVFDTRQPAILMHPNPLASYTTLLFCPGTPPPHLCVFIQISVHRISYHIIGTVHEDSREDDKRQSAPQSRMEPLKRSSVTHWLFLLWRVEKDDLWNVRILKMQLRGVEMFVWEATWMSH